MSLISKQRMSTDEQSTILLPTVTLVLDSGSGKTMEVSSWDALGSISFISSQEDGRSPNDSGILRIHLDLLEYQLLSVIQQTAQAYVAGRLDLSVATSMDSSSSAIQLDHEQRQHDDKNASRPRSLTVRVAGGWVRDKLLGGIDTHDVDIAVDTLTGVQFAGLVQSYIHAMSSDKPDSTLCSDRIGVISANPNQSKHLETATMKVLGYDVDFSNLRSEEYGTESSQNGSRIPTQVRFGTPYQDATRRDFTINALFYNLSTMRVEDYTNLGLSHLLRDKIIHTPMVHDPTRTFDDDPLRILRAIRFSVRYQFQLSASIQQAILLPEIRTSLKFKVSRERIGKELEGMLSGQRARPTEALLLILRLRLAGSVFMIPAPTVTAQQQLVPTLVVNDPMAPLISKVYGPLDVPQLSSIPFPASPSTGRNNETDQPFYTGDCHEAPATVALRQRSWEEAEQFLRWWDCVQNYFLSSPLQVPISSSEAESKLHPIDSTILKQASRLCPIASLLLPWRAVQYENPRKEARTFPVISHILQFGLKFRGVDVNSIALIMKLVDPMSTLLRQHGESRSRDESSMSNDCAAPSRLDVGLLIREARELWVATMLVATVLVLRQEERAMNQPSDVPSLPSLAISHWLQVLADFYQLVKVGYQLDQCWLERPLLDGKAIKNYLQLSNGPIVGTFMDAQVRWMLQNPGGTREGCLDYLRSLHSRATVADSDP
jgi:tRNA nucleotidyltransferase (CCA-adding enzyme)